MSYTESKQPIVTNKGIEYKAPNHRLDQIKSNVQTSPIKSPIKETDLQSIYEDGQKSAEKLGDINDYTRVVYGLSAVLKSKGVVIKPMELANIWHMPLVMIKLNMKIDQVIKSMEGEFKRFADGNMPYEIEHGLSYQNISYYINKIESAKNHDPQKDVDNIIEYNIKQKYPKIRKNSKQYKEQVSIISDKALNLAKKNKEESIKESIKSLQEYYNNTAKKTISKAREHAKDYESRSDVIEALIPNSEYIPKVRNISKDINKRVDEYENLIIRHL